MAATLVGTLGTPVASNSAATAYNITGVTVPSGATLLLVGATWQAAGDPNSVVWDSAGVNETLTMGPSATDGTVQTAMFYRLAPSATTGSITLTWGTNRSAIGAACTIWTGTGSSSAANTFLDSDSLPSNGTPTLTLDFAMRGRGGVMVDYLGSAADPTIGADQVSYHNGAPAGANLTNADGSYQVAGSTAVMAWTLGTFFVHAAYSVLPENPTPEALATIVTTPSMHTLLASSQR